MLQPVLDHAVLLLVVVPAIGGLLVRLVGRLSIDGAQSIAQSNVWATLFLLGLIVANFKPLSDDESHSWQFESSIRLAAVPFVVAPESVDSEEPAPKPPKTTFIRLAVGVDELALPFVVLLIVATFVAVFKITRERSRELNDEPQILDGPLNVPSLFEVRLADALWIESSILSVLTATDVVWLGFSSIIAVCCLARAIGRSQSDLAVSAAAKFLRSQLMSSILLLTSVVGLAVACAWMSIRRSSAAPLNFDLVQILDRLPTLMPGTQAAHDYWELMGPWLFLLLVGACVLRIPIPPFHAWWSATWESSDCETGTLIAVGWLPTGFVIAARWLPRVFLSETDQLGDRVLLWVLLAACGAALASLAVNNVTRRSGYLTMSVSVLAFGSLWIGTEDARNGAVLFLIGACTVVGITRFAALRWWQLLPLILTACGAGVWRLAPAYWDVSRLQIVTATTVSSIVLSLICWPRLTSTQHEDPITVTDK